MTSPSRELDLSDEQAVRKSGRSLAERRGGGIVSVDVFPSVRVPLAQLIYKKQEGAGYLYMAMLFVPSSSNIYVFTLVCGERSVTGVREAAVTAMLAEKGLLTVERFDQPGERATGRVRGWFVDPYDPGYPGPILRSVSDDETYDEMFPQHPLSRMRRMLSTLRDTIRLPA